VRAARNGRKIDVSLTVSPIRNSTGVVIGTSQIVHDISETKAQEEAIRISEERQRLAVDAGQIGLWFVDIQTGRRIFNQRFRELHGMRAEEVIPDYPTPLTVIHAEDRSAVELAVRRAMETSTDIAVEYRTKGLDFRTKWLQCRGRARRDSKGNLTGIHGTVIDLTERREMENKLRRMNAELEQFAYAAAHDLQEPLRNVALAAALLKAEPAEVLAVQDPPLLHTIIENSRRMEAMVKDLLSYSRALDGPEGQPVETDANLVLRQVLENLEAAVREKAPSITFDPLPYVFMHHTHLLQILQNLLSNSLKYSGSRPLQIWVGAKIRADDVLIFVKDNGMGISPQFHERAFGMFKRLHNGSITGTGIGLAVCRRIVEHYGGRIWIESQLGEGATFSFTIPTASNR
jgi:PAS domain S-box-containing protein